MKPYHIAYLHPITIPPGPTPEQVESALAKLFSTANPNPANGRATAPPEPEHETICNYTNAQYAATLIRGVKNGHTTAASPLMMRHQI